MLRLPGRVGLCYVFGLGDRWIDWCRLVFTAPEPADGPAKLKLTSQSYKPAVHLMLQTPTIRKRRSDYPDTENLCEHCTAKCCHYFALPIDEPTERRDFDFIRWYLLHDRATVFVDDGVWYLLVHTTCKHLRSDYMCGIYETRPLICRAYKTDNCEFESDWCYEQYFETPEQIHEYTEAMLGPDPLITGNHEGCVRSRKPTGLPMV